MRKTASLRRWLAMGALVRWLEAAWGSGRDRGPFYSVTRSVPRRPWIGSTAAVDRNGEPLFCSLQRDVSRLGMAAEASRQAGTASGASWRARVARAAPSMAGACCGRPLAAMADLTAALWGSKGGLEGSGERARPGRGPVGEQRPGARCGGSAACACKTCTLGTPRARTLRVRQNAKACQGAPIHMRFSRVGL